MDRGSIVLVSWVSFSLSDKLFNATLKVTLSLTKVTLMSDIQNAI
jgi:hypothetical protein